jgi:hypothetical protein
LFFNSSGLLIPATSWSLPLSSPPPFIAPPARASWLPRDTTRTEQRAEVEGGQGRRCQTSEPVWLP